MAPALIVSAENPPQPTKNVEPIKNVEQDTEQTTTREPVNYTPGRTQAREYNDYPYDDLKPIFPDIKWPALEVVPFEDKGILGDPAFKNLLRDPNTEIFDYGPKIGTEIRGIRLNELDDAQKNDLARLIATRGCVFVRDQKDFNIDDQRALGQYWGVLHKHATTGIPKRPGLEDVHVVYSAENSGDFRAVFTPTFLWHSDITYEIQPPAYTSLKMLTGPPRGGGGDTLWSSMYAVFDALSPQMQKYLEGLTALHSAKLQADNALRSGKPVRREPILTEHPLIRVNPVTGWKSVFYNPGFVRKIAGVPKFESDAILRMLDEVFTTVPEARAILQWRENDVAFWDNRVCNHSATYGFEGHRRHAVRVCCHGEKPYYDPAGKTQEEELRSLDGLPPRNKNCAGDSNYND